jgi:cysteine desulfurase
MAAEAERLRGMRDGLRRKLEAGLDEVTVNGSMDRRLPNNLNLSFGGVDSESLLMGLHDVALSSGSACTSATIEPSHVLKALGIGRERAQGAIRFGLGRFNTAEEMDYVAGRIVEVVRRLRELSPVSPAGGR